MNKEKRYLSENGSFTLNVNRQMNGALIVCSSENSVNISQAVYQLNVTCKLEMFHIEQ